MEQPYYRSCPELEQCNKLIQDYFEKKQYEPCFQGHLRLAQTGYPLAKCQVGYFYLEGLGVESDLEQAVYWTRRAALHGDRDGQCNLAWFYEEGIGVQVNPAQAKEWYQKAARQGHDLALEKCVELGVPIEEGEE